MSGRNGSVEVARRLPVILDHDGSVDDLVALLLALTAPELELLAVVVTDGDCYGEPAVAASGKLCGTLARADVPIALSRQRALNPFPAEWRRDSFVLNELPALNRVRSAPASASIAPSGEALLIETIAAATEPVTVLATGPLSNLAHLCRERPDLLPRIREIVWMGGAIDVPGNVDPHREFTHDGSAEWNSFWDPDAVATVLASPVQLTVLPLDATNELLLDPVFLERIRGSNEVPAQVCGQAYSLVCFRDYYAWDVGAVAYAVWPELFRTERVRLAVATTGRAAGRVCRDERGREVLGLMGVDHAQLWWRLADLWAPAATTHRTEIEPQQASS